MNDDHATMSAGQAERLGWAGPWLKKFYDEWDESFNAYLDLLGDEGMMIAPSHTALEERYVNLRKRLRTAAETISRLRDRGKVVADMLRDEWRGRIDGPGKSPFQRLLDDLENLAEQEWAGRLRREHEIVAGRLSAENDQLREENVRLRAGAE